MDIVRFFFVGEFVESIDDFSVVPFSVSDVFGGPHYGYVELSAASAYVIPVYEIDMSEFSAVKNAVFDGHGLASAEEDGSEMAVGVHAGEIAGLVDESSEFSVDGSGMTVISFVCVIGYHLAHYVEQVVLQILKIEAVYVMRAFLDHYGTCGMMRCYAYRTVLDTGCLYYLNHFL